MAIMHRARKPAAMSLTLLVILAAILTPAPVQGEEKGIVVPLSYIRGYSNWGPTNVYGTAQLWPQEGVAVLSAHNLPHLLNGDKYVGWIVNTRSGDALLLDTFNTSEAGDGSIDVIFEQKPPEGANAVIVTVMHPGDPTALPGPQRTLSGIFPPLVRPGPKAVIVNKSSTNRPPASKPLEKLKAKPVRSTPGGGQQVHIQGDSKEKHAEGKTRRRPVELPHTGGGWLLRKQHTPCSGHKGQPGHRSWPCPPTKRPGDAPAAHSRQEAPLLTRLF